MDNVQEARDALYGEVASLFKEKNRVVLELATGSGKSLLALKLIDDDSGYYDIVCPTIDIVKSWHDEIEKHNLTHLLPRLRIYAYQSLHKYGDTRGVNYILDEVHRSCTEKRIGLIKENLKQHNKIIGLSATVGFDQKEMLSKLGIYRGSYVKMTTDESINKGFISDYRMVVYRVKMGDQKESLPRFKNPISEVAAYNFTTKMINKASANKDWKQVSFWAIYRKQVISGLKSKERVAEYLINKLPLDKKTLVFSTNIAQSDRLVPEGSYHSKGDQSIIDRYNSGHINVMSSVMKLIEGVNIKADILIKLSVDSKERNLVQSAGRLLRKDPNNPDKVAVVVVLVAKDTVEEKWMTDSIGSFKNVLIKDWKS